MLKNIIFDFDGVICDSIDYHLNKLNSLFNLDLTKKEYADAHLGNANKEMIDDIKSKFSKVDWNKYHEEIEKDFPLMKIKPEVKEVLERLAQKYNLFIISSGHNQHIIDFLKNNGVWNLFKKSLFLEDAKLKVDKFKILENNFKVLPKNSIFITDTIGDIKEGREVGYESIGITTGHHDRELLASEKPFVIIDSFTELEDVLIKFNKERLNDFKLK